MRLSVCTRSCRRSAMHAAERRGDAGKARHQRALQPDLADQRAGMQRAAAAERHGDETSPDRGRARSRPAGSRRPCAHRRRARSPRRRRCTSSPSGSPTCVAMARLAASTSSDCSSPPIGRAALMRPSTTCASVSVGRVLPCAVAGGSRHRAGAFRSDLEQPAAIDRGDRAAAGADGGDLDHRRADHQAEIDGGLRRERRPCRRRSPRRRTTCRRDRR